ncbi:MAG: chloride channel protein [Hydrococcus sp. C42_A2020_068]|uniref:chloride channel protein n=1 Tax=Pleurocapsa sp. PCC 7327 TaxID=118163 RepID=UPI00029FDBDB|nr:chloride channel protein [Pleurocapsa sp. PCC 7327]AFY79570.1 chloride channel protein EriC [Pleurocapsa sp. PCC 7327]MBF2021144.1 chloride channel protein [Hydrococcus sp. C42_A2020_068]
MTTALPESKVLLPPTPKPVSLSDRLTSFLNRLQPSPEVLVLISALFIGGSTGLALILFHHLIALFQTLAFNELLDYISPWGAWMVAFIPILGGCLVGLMRWQFSEFFGQGLLALLSDTRVQPLSPLRPAIEMLAAAVSLGTGASLGPEGPSVEIGANVGIILGQVFQVSKERYRLLLGAGAAAGLAAGFNAPIAGVFFALEVVLGTTFTTPAASLILLSAVVSAVIARICMGARPAFDLPPYQVLSNWEWLLYLGLGLLASLVSMLFVWGIQFFQASFQGKVPGLVWLGKLPEAIKPVIGGACVGLVALQFSQVLGVGYGTIEVILKGKESYSLPLLCLLLLFKLLLTGICLGSGLVGGIFAPAMFLGACLGAIYGNILTLALPVEIAPTAAYAMVGMAAVLASSAKAPLTAIILLFELTQNYLIILPLMTAVGVSVWIVERLKSSQSLPDLKLQQMGVNLEKQEEQEPLEHLPTALVMGHSYLGLPASMSLLEAGQIMCQNKCHTALVLDEMQQLAGIISLADIKRRLVLPIKEPSAELHPIDRIIEQPLREICIEEVLYAHEDEPVNEVLVRMEARGLYLLPVVERDNLRKVLGVVERHQIGLASDLAETQKVLRDYLPEPVISDELPTFSRQLEAASASALPITSSDESH